MADTLFCAHCGTPNEPHWGDLGWDLRPCASCGRQPVSMTTLLLNLNLYDVTHRRCARCGRLGAADDYCFGCGASFGAGR